MPAPGIPASRPRRHRSAAAGIPASRPRRHRPAAAGIPVRSAGWQGATPGSIPSSGYRRNGPAPGTPAHHPGRHGPTTGRIPSRRPCRGRAAPGRIPAPGLGWPGTAGRSGRTGGRGWPGTAGRGGRTGEPGSAPCRIPAGRAGRARATPRTRRTRLARNPHRPGGTATTRPCRAAQARVSARVALAGYAAGAGTRWAACAHIRVPPASHAIGAGTGLCCIRVGPATRAATTRTARTSRADRAGQARIRVPPATRATTTRTARTSRAGIRVPPATRTATTTARTSQTAGTGQARVRVLAAGPMSATRSGRCAPRVSGRLGPSTAARAFGIEVSIGGSVGRLAPGARPVRAAVLGRPPRVAAGQLIAVGGGRVAAGLAGRHPAARPALVRGGGRRGEIPFGVSGRRVIGISSTGAGVSTRPPRISRLARASVAHGPPTWCWRDLVRPGSHPIMGHGCGAHHRIRRAHQGWPPPHAPAARRDPGAGAAQPHRTSRAAQAPAGPAEQAIQPPAPLKLSPFRNTGHSLKHRE